MAQAAGFGSDRLRVGLPKPAQLPRHGNSHHAPAAMPRWIGRCLAAATACAGFAVAAIPAAQACTRVLYTAANQTVIAGRSMDWHTDNSPSLWAMPRGMARDGATGPGSIRWTSRYGSLVVSMYNIATVDGINEKGMVANTLYLAESNYGSPEGKPTLSIAAWAQYVLDNYATVKEAVAQ